MSSDHPVRSRQSMVMLYVIIVVIYCTYIRANFKWVKGHQDNNTRYKKNPLEAQLNVDSDKLAGEYQEEQGQFHPMIHTLLPGCPAMLSIGGGISVTSNYRKQLIGAYVEPNYIEYLQ